MSGPVPCPLCGGPVASRPERAAGRRLLDCPGCGLVSVHPQDRPDPEAERAQYRLHENDPDDPRYRAFLAQLTGPLVERLAPGAAGLDFGCGPGPAIGPMLQAAGFRVRDYDPIFRPDAAALRDRYDFVACTEVAEHFHAPGAAFARLAGLLRPGGWLGVMTLLLQAETDLAHWAYARDPTHVAFYRPRTLRWIAARHGWRLTTDGRRIALFQRPAC